MMFCDLEYSIHGRCHVFCERCFIFYWFLFTAEIFARKKVFCIQYRILPTWDRCLQDQGTFRFIVLYVHTYLSCHFPILH